MIYIIAALVIVDIILLISLIATRIKPRKKGVDKQSIHKNGTPYDDKGFARFGFDKDGFNAYGFDRNGYDRQGYDRAGYDRSGFDRSGYNRLGYDKSGFNRSGFNAKGYDVNGFDADGYNAAGKNARGQYDRFFDRDAFGGGIHSVEGFLSPRIYTVSLSTHAKERMHERMGLVSEQDMMKLALEAYRYGKSSRQVMKTVAAKMIEKEQVHNDRVVLLYRNYVYIFSRDNCLITVYPNEYIH